VTTIAVGVSLSDILSEINQISNDQESKQWEDMGVQIGKLIQSVEQFGSLQVLEQLFETIAAEWGYKAEDKIEQYTQEQWEVVSQVSNKFVTKADMIAHKIGEYATEAARETEKGADT